MHFNWVGARLYVDKLQIYRLKRRLLDPRSQAVMAFVSGVAVLPFCKSRTFLAFTRRLATREGAGEDEQTRVVAPRGKGLKRSLLPYLYAT